MRLPNVRVPGGTPEGLEPLAVNARDAAKLLGISELKFLGLDATGELGPPAIKKCGRSVWPYAELRAWVAAGMPERETWLAWLEQAKKEHAEKAKGN